VGPGYDTPASALRRRGPEIWTTHPLDVGPSYGSRFEGLCYRNLLAYTIP
jgi:hypothetical protein